VAILSLLLAACSQAGPYDTLAPAGPVAERQKSLFMLVFWIAVGVFVLVEGALVFALFRFRQRRRDELPVQVHGNTRLEIIWTIIPALILAGVAVPTVGTIFQLAVGPPPGAMEITVTGHQWWWEVEYENENEGVVTANEIHIPVDEPVFLTLTSEDVIHSFWVPRLAGKQDLVPGKTEALTIQADEPGTYLGECTEYCGLSHANMRFLVVAETEEDFQTWVSGQRQTAVDPTADSEAAEGLEVFRTPLPQGTGTCIACHAVEGIEGAAAEIGPDLTHFGSRQTLAGGILPNTPEELARWLANPPGVKPGSKMPDYNLTDEQIEALVAYLHSLE
jgi:cytochrome c oxidase subunit II